jgi:hypothetical protein
MLGVKGFDGVSSEINEPGSLRILTLLTYIDVEFLPSWQPLRTLRVGERERRMFGKVHKEGLIRGFRDSEQDPLHATVR